MRLQRLKLGVLAALAVACSWCVPARAADYVAKQVPAAAPDPVDLITITTPAATPAAETVVIGRFVTDFPAPGNPVDELSFRLDTHDLTRFPFEQFRIDEGNVTLEDTDLEPPDNAVAVLKAEVIGAPDLGANYRVIQVSLEYIPGYDFASLGSRTWKIRALAKPASIHYWGFHEAGVGETAIEANVTQPRLVQFDPNGPAISDFVKAQSFTSLPDTTSFDFGNIHVDAGPEYAASWTFAFVNVGTASYTIESVDPSAAPAGPFGLVTYFSPREIRPMLTELTEVVTFKPTALGSVATPTIVLRNSTHGNHELALRGTGVQLKGAVLIDTSGSMMEDLQGNYVTPVVQERTKIWAARRGALEFAELYGAVSPQALLALYTYPNRVGGCPSNELYIDYANVPENHADPQYVKWANHLDPELGHPALLTVDSMSRLTPMAEGIKATFEALTDHGQFERVGVFMFGDGQHTCSSGGGNPTPASWRNELEGKTVPFYTVPYGDPGDTYFQTFSNIAEWSDGDDFPANASTEDLQKPIKNALRELLDMEPLVDPTTTIASGATKEHPVCVTESTDQFVFSVHWKSQSPNALKQNPNALNVTLRSPTSVVYTPGSASLPTISYVSGENYAAYVVRGDLLQGSKGSGQWTLVVKANEGVSYTYQAFAKDRVTSAPQMTAVPGLLNLGLSFYSEEVKYLQGIKIEAEYTAPSASYATFLASTKVGMAELQEVPQVEGREPLSWAERKAYVLRNRKDNPQNMQRKAGKVLLASAALDHEPPVSPAEAPAPAANRPSQSKASIDGKAAPKPQLASDALSPHFRYAAQLKDLRVTGMYDMVLRVTAQTAAKQCFQREYEVATIAGAALTRGLLEKSVTLAQVEPAQLFTDRLELLDEPLRKVLAQPVKAGFSRHVLKVEPKDEFDNYYGIGRASEVAFQVEGGEKLGAVQDGLDGSYYQVVEYAEGAKLAAKVSVGDVSTDEPVVLTKESPPFGKWLIVLLLALAVVAVFLGLRRRK